VWPLRSFFVGGIVLLRLAAYSAVIVLFSLVAACENCRSLPKFGEEAAAFLGVWGEGGWGEGGRGN